MTLAAQLDATNIRIEPRNKRGKVAKKVKDVVKLAISFTVVKNITAENGERTIYIRITKPDNDVLTKSASNTFPYEIVHWFILSRSILNIMAKNRISMYSGM